MRCRVAAFLAVVGGWLVRPTPALAGMPSVDLSDWAALRVEAISFFLLVLLGSAAVVRWLWNSLAADFLSASTADLPPRIGRSRALGSAPGRRAHHDRRGPRAARRRGPGKSKGCSIKWPAPRSPSRRSAKPKTRKTSAGNTWPRCKRPSGRTPPRMAGSFRPSPIWRSKPRFGRCPAEAECATCIVSGKNGGQTRRSARTTRLRAGNLRSEPPRVDHRRADRTHDLQPSFAANSARRNRHETCRMGMRLSGGAGACLSDCAGLLAFPVELVFYLVVGWVPFLMGTIPQMTIEPAAVVVAGARWRC